MDEKPYRPYIPYEDIPTIIAAFDEVLKDALSKHNLGPAKVSVVAAYRRKWFEAYALHHAKLSFVEQFTTKPKTPQELMDEHTALMQQAYRDAGLLANESQPEQD